MNEIEFNLLVIDSTLNTVELKLAGEEAKDFKRKLDVSTGKRHKGKRELYQTISEYLERIKGMK